MKTITIVAKDENPIVTLCKGHVTATIFNKAFRAEGWAKGDWIHKNQLRHEYWRKSKKCKGQWYWDMSKKQVKGTVPVTVMDW